MPVSGPPSPSSTAPAPFQVRKIAIVGAGPCGLAAASYLSARRDFHSIVVFEQQHEVGGIWNYSHRAAAPCPVPQTDPFQPPEDPIRSQTGSAPVFPSPLYDNLFANIPGPLMKFSDQDFPKDSPIFPFRQDIHRQLLAYALPVRHLIRFCHQVDKISLVPGHAHDKWLVEAHSTTAQHPVREVFDAVVIANGHYALPYIPDLPNSQRFHQAFPSVVTHSKQYRSPEPFKDKKVIVVGNGPSGIDIALQINRLSKGQVLLSVRQPTPPERLAHTGCREVAEIEDFLVEKRGVRFKDGTVETDIDSVIFCTGFLFSYPFLPDYQHDLITNGAGVHGLYKHLFYIRHPTLAFPGLNVKSVPWPLGEAQAAVIAAVWANDIRLPSFSEMQTWSRQLLEAEGEALHVFSPLADGHYINGLYDWAIQATVVPKLPPRWDEKLFWLRRIGAEAKLRFEQQGCTATSLEELGFYYVPGTN